MSGIQHEGVEREVGHKVGNAAEHEAENAELAEKRVEDKRYTLKRRVEDVQETVQESLKGIQQVSKRWKRGRDVTDVAVVSQVRYVLRDIAKKSYRAGSRYGSES